jgi:hypothetical protein
LRELIPGRTCVSVVPDVVEETAPAVVVELASAAVLTEGWVIGVVERGMDDEPDISIPL